MSPTCPITTWSPLRQTFWTEPPWPRPATLSAGAAPLARAACDTGGPVCGSATVPGGQGHAACRPRSSLQDATSCPSFWGAHWPAQGPRACGLRRLSLLSLKESCSGAHCASWSRAQGISEVVLTVTKLWAPQAGPRSPPGIPGSRQGKLLYLVFISSLETESWSQGGARVGSVGSWEGGETVLTATGLRALGLGVKDSATQLHTSFQRLCTQARPPGHTAR